MSHNKIESEAQRRKRSVSRGDKIGKSAGPLLQANKEEVEKKEEGYAPAPEQEKAKCQEEKSEKKEEAKKDPVEAGEMQPSGSEVLMGWSGGMLEADWAQELEEDEEPIPKQER